jgi:hypothetical protein
MVSVRVFVEGGGDQALLRTACRRGFSEFFKKVLPAGHLPRIIACGSRNEAFDAFVTSVRQVKGEEMSLLLVDSEGPVDTATDASAHLERRDGWKRPRGVRSDQVHLMVECMEAWLIADRELLARYFGRGFRERAVPRRVEPEQIPKRELERGLYAATKDSRPKGAYEKGRDSFELLAQVDAARVIAMCPRARALVEMLKRTLA